MTNSFIEITTKCQKACQVRKPSALVTELRPNLEI